MTIPGGTFGMIADIASLSVLMLGCIMACTIGTFSEPKQRHYAAFLLLLGTIMVIPLKLAAVVLGIDRVAATTSTVVAVVVLSIGVAFLLRKPNTHEPTDTLPPLPPPVEPGIWLSGLIDRFWNAVSRWAQRAGTPPGAVAASSTTETPSTPAEAPRSDIRLVAPRPHILDPEE